MMMMMSSLACERMLFDTIRVCHSIKVVVCLMSSSSLLLLLVAVASEGKALFLWVAILVVGVCS